jgi:hypothetical protein
MKCRLQELGSIQGDLEDDKPYPKQDQGEAIQFSAVPPTDRLRIPVTESLDE